MKDSQAFNLLNQFLAINTYDEKKKYDLILVLGNAIAETGLIAYQLYKTGHAYHFMIAGGKGHTTDILINTIKEKYDIKDITKRSEAELFKYLIEENYGVDNTILFEKESTNCGENIQFAFKLLKKEDIIVKNILLVHDPLMQRRIDATARHYAPHINFDNYRCFLPVVENIGFELKNNIWGLWSKERYISLLLGEMKRVIDDKDGYGPNGKQYIEHVEVPQKILAAYRYIFFRYGKYQRK